MYGFLTILNEFWRTHAIKLFTFLNVFCYWTACTKFLLCGYEVGEIRKNNFAVEFAVQFLYFEFLLFWVGLGV